MKLKKAELEKCLNILLKVKSDRHKEFIAENRKKAKEYANEQLELKNPEAFRMLQFAKNHDLGWMLKEDYRIDCVYILQVNWCNDYKIGLQEDQVFRDMCFEFITKEKSMNTEINDLWDQLEGIIKASKKSDLIEQFPEIAHILNDVKPNVCTSLVCISDIKEKLK